MLNIFKNIFMMLILLAGTLLAATGINENEVRINVKLINSNAILCEPLPTMIEIINEGKKPFEIYRGIYNYEDINVIVNNQKNEYILCAQELSVLKLPYSILVNVIQPGEKLVMNSDLRCYPPFWQAGNYNVQYVVNINKKDYLSQLFMLNIGYPTGIDLEAFEKGQIDNKVNDNYCIKRVALRDKKKICSPCVSATSEKIFAALSNKDLIAKYPTSRYTAWAANKTIIDLTSLDEKRIAEGIKKKIYPKTEKALWMKEKGNEILKSYPDFAYAEKIKVAVAISEIVLDNETEGIKILQDLVQNSQSKEAEWSKRFLDAWSQKKILK
jgi:hypothetical protein